MNEPLGMGGNRIEKDIPAHLYYIGALDELLKREALVIRAHDIMPKSPGHIDVYNQRCLWILKKLYIYVRQLNVMLESIIFSVVWFVWLLKGLYRRCDIQNASLNPHKNLLQCWYVEHSSTFSSYSGFLLYCPVFDPSCTNISALRYDRLRRNTN